MRINCDPKSLPKPRLNPTKPVRVPDKVSKAIEFGMIPRHEYAEKLQRARESSRANRKDAWTDEEIEILKRMFKGGYDLNIIAENLPDRTFGAVEAKARKMRKRGEL